jgi:hypothetical protein
MKDFIVGVLSVAIQSVVTYYYFDYFGLSWQSVIPLFITVQYVKFFAFKETN